MDTATLIKFVTLYALPVLFAITVHEAAHAYAAKYFGDDTAWKLGRVTFNPMNHIDPVGTVLMPLLLYFATSGAFLFGYAKPVPIRFGKLRHPKRDMVWVALAGPAANLVMALLWGIGYFFLKGAGITEPFFTLTCQAGIHVNVVLFALNTFPLPPLDGGRILVGLLPDHLAIKVAKIEPYGFFVVMALIVLQVVNTLWMQPVMALTNGFLSILLSPFAALFGS